MASFSIARRFPQISIPASSVMPVRLPTGFQRIEHERNNRYCAGCRLEDNHDGISSGDDHIRVAGHDLARQIGITLVMPLGGIAFDYQIFSFNVSQAA
jgi:hypothetical protein